MKGRITREQLYSELDLQVKKLHNPKLKDRSRTKKHILRLLSKNKFKKPYLSAWWRDYRAAEVNKLLASGKYECPECGIACSNPTLQHIWHPTPFRVLCTQNINDQDFISAIPKYIDLQEKEKRALNTEEYERWLRWTGKTNKFKQVETVAEYAYSKTSSNYALGYFSSDELLLFHIEEVRRHIKLLDKDYKFVCKGCAFKEDKAIIESGRLSDAPYFLWSKDCTRRDLLAQAVADRLLQNLKKEEE